MKAFVFTGQGNEYSQMAKELYENSPFAKDFIDKDFLLKQKAEGVKRKLVHFECKERAIPRNGYELCDADGNTIGNVTSGIMLPTTKVGIGMGYVKTEFAKKGGVIYVKIREKLIPCEIV